jgi:formylglycine-generating enzyme required for sulfatase activity
MAIFDAERAYGIPFGVRLDAANALGLTGDPRLDEDNFVPIKGGTFWMGADDKNRGRKETVKSFSIGRYLVTVAEYQRFVEARGYSIKEYWGAGGFGKFTEPDEGEERLDEPKNRPVTGVSWYEASAYCIWNKGRLPGENEWEFAARANREGVKYPWGSDEPDERLANYAYKDSPGNPTPVGLYPAGATPTGLHDMAGNVWEWVEDLYPEFGDSRKLRGCGWSSYDASLRVVPRRGLPERSEGRFRVSVRPGSSFRLGLFFFGRISGPCRKAREHPPEDLRR